MRPKEEVGRHVEKFGELLCLRFADRPLSAHNLRGDAEGTKHVQQVALTEAVLFHHAAQPAVGRRSPECIVCVLEGFDKHSQEFGVLPLFRREFVMALVHLLQLADEALILLLGTNDRWQLARQKTPVGSISSTEFFIAASNPPGRSWPVWRCPIGRWDGGQDRTWRYSSANRALCLPGRCARVKRRRRAALRQVAYVAKPDTILAWYRQLIARKFDGSKLRTSPGRPRISLELEALIVRFARENGGLGYDRIVGGSRQSRLQQTVKNFLRRYGIQPAPKRMAGCGWAQREGGPIEEIRPGDVVWFALGEKHWHAATPTTAITHMAIQEELDGKVVEWMEQVIRNTENESTSAGRIVLSARSSTGHADHAQRLPNSAEGSAE